MNIVLLLAKIVAFALSGSKAVLASLADSAGKLLPPTTKFVLALETAVHTCLQSHSSYLTAS